MHVHIIANRINLYGEVYDTTFVSNRAARVAEDLSRKYGLTIAKEVKAERTHKKTKASPTREQTKQQVQQICYALLNKYKGTGITGHSMFLYELNKNGITIERLKNKQGNLWFEVLIWWTIVQGFRNRQGVWLPFLAEELRDKQQDRTKESHDNGR